MSVRVQLFEIRNQLPFLQSFLINPAAPDPGPPDAPNFVPVPDARVRLIGRLSLGALQPFRARFFADEGVTGPDGSVELDLPVAPPGTEARVRLIAFRSVNLLLASRRRRSARRLRSVSRPAVRAAVTDVVNPLPGLEGRFDDILDNLTPNLPTLQGVAFRSATVDPAQLESHTVNIFVQTLAPLTITQADVDTLVAEQLDALKEELEEQGVKFDEITAELAPRGLKITITRGRNTITVDVSLRPGQSSDLDQFVDFTIEDVELDLTKLGRLCKNETVLEQNVRTALRQGLRGVIAEIKEQQVSSVPNSQFILPFLSVSLMRLEFPLDAQTETRSLVATPSIGVPQQLLV